MSETSRSLATVVHVIDDYTIVINRGSLHGVLKGAKFLVYGVGNTILDPDTGENLGVLEIVRGRAVVSHVQEKLSTLVSDEYTVTPGTKRRIKRQGGTMVFLGNQPAVEEIEEGEERNNTSLDALTGDRARPI